MATTEQMLEIVDIDRARGLIEELFKALKTGCQYQRLQLESYSALLRALGIYLPLAWRLLRLRYLSGTCSKSTPARAALNQTQIDVLRAVSPIGLPARPTLREELLSVAALGGHISRNAEPGWMVLGRGMQDLVRLQQGWRAAMVAQQCDPS